MIKVTSYSQNASTVSFDGCKAKKHWLLDDFGMKCHKAYFRQIISINIPTSKFGKFNKILGNLEIFREIIFWQKKYGLSVLIFSVKISLISPLEKNNFAVFCHTDSSHYTTYEYLKSLFSNEPNSMIQQ